MTSDSGDKDFQRSFINRLDVLRHNRYWANVTAIETLLSELQPKLDDLISLLEEIQLPKPINVGLDPTDALEIARIDEAAFSLYYLMRLSRKRDESCADERN